MMGNLIKFAREMKAPEFYNRPDKRGNTALHYLAARPEYYESLALNFPLRLVCFIQCSGANCEPLSKQPVTSTKHSNSMYMY